MVKFAMGLDISNVPLYFGILFLIGVAVLGIIAIFTKVPYQRNNLLTKTELEFYKIIRRHIEPYYDLYIQVRLASLVKIDERYFLWRWFNPLGAKTVDFVICDKETNKTLLVLELDDKTHRWARRKRRDKFVNGVLKQAKIPILHIWVKDEYNLSYILGAIKRKIAENNLTP